MPTDETDVEVVRFADRPPRSLPGGPDVRRPELPASGWDGVIRWAWRPDCWPPCGTRGCRRRSPGEVEVPEALVPVHVDVAQDHAVDVEPNVWVAHPIREG